LQTVARIARQIAGGVVVRHPFLLVQPLERTIALRTRPNHPADAAVIPRPAGSVIHPAADSRGGAPSAGSIGRRLSRRDARAGPAAKAIAAFWHCADSSRILHAGTVAIGALACRRSMHSFSPQPLPP